MKVRMDALGDVVLSREFLRPAESAADLSPAFDVILDQFEDWTGRQFESEGAEFGDPWEPLADSTIASKARAGAADPTQALLLTGALALSLQGGPGGVRSVGPGEAEWGTRNENAMWHHGRKRSADNPVPRRAIFELDEARRRWVFQQLQREVFGR